MGKPTKVRREGGNKVTVGPGEQPGAEEVGRVDGILRLARALDKAAASIEESP